MTERKSKRPTITLKLWGSTPDSPQAKFEHAAIRELKLNASILLIDLERNCYTHRQVQWLWKQYQKGIK